MSGNGGPAFPIAPYKIDVHGGCKFFDGEPGMSLRDYFAAKAMQAMASELEETLDQLASDAYAIADAMLAERERAR